MNLIPKIATAPSGETPQVGQDAKPERRVLHVPRGEGRAVWVVGDTYTFKAVSKNTGGQLFAWEAEIPPHAGPPAHVHLNQFEAYYLLEGELEVLDGNTTFTATAGSFVFIPAGAVHAFRNRSDRPARMLIWMTPGGFEDFFLEVGQPARRGETAPLLGPEEGAKMVRAAARHGLELVDAPAWRG
jgi:quercetin dioxygenase-like cupin family protein